MKAYTFKHMGVEDSLKVIDFDMPKPNKNEVLIKIKAFAINPVELKTLLKKPGGLNEMLKSEDPIILGSDIAGEVVDTGEQVTKFKTGDNVFGMINFPGHGKGHAEYCTAPENHVTYKPADVSYQEAAASTLAALTAYQILSKNIKSGDTVLIHAASGGVGHYAVQIAKELGAYVIGTGSSINKEFLTSIGLDEFIDYKTTDFSEKLKNIDYVFDTVATDEESFIKSIKVVRHGGHVTNLNSEVPYTDKVVNLALANNVKIGFEYVVSSAADMEKIAILLKTKKIIPHISHNFDFANTKKAFEQLATGRTVGKIVVTVK